MVTVDRSIPYQQLLASGKLALLIIRADSNKLSALLRYVPECLDALGYIKPGQVVPIGRL